MERDERARQVTPEQLQGTQQMRGQHLRVGRRGGADQGHRRGQVVGRELVGRPQLRYADLEGQFGGAQTPLDESAAASAEYGTAVHGRADVVMGQLSLHGVLPGWFCTGVREEVRGRGCLAYLAALNTPLPNE